MDWVIIFRQHAASIYGFVHLYVCYIKQNFRPLLGKVGDLWWKMTLGGRQPLLEDDLQWKTTFSERRPSGVDDFWWKTTFGERRPFGERQPSVEDDI